MRRRSAFQGTVSINPSNNCDGFWLNLQGHYDLEVEKDRLSEALKEIEPLADAS
jgi:hypothetical protein